LQSGTDFNYTSICFMKKWYSALLSCALSCFTSTFLLAQTPQAIPYQAVARNSSGALITNQAVSLRFTIHTASATGTVVYQETQAATTNAYGLFTVTIGTGTVVSGSLSGIDWSTGTKYMQVELDATGGTSYTNMGTQQLLSVPYALYAQKSSNATSPYGSGEAGALNITTNTDWTTTPQANLNFQYTTITVASGFTLTVPSGTTLRATGNVTISGTIVVAPGTADQVGRPHPGVSISSPAQPSQGLGITSTAAAQLIRMPLYGGGAGAKTSSTSSGGEGGGSFRIIAQGNIQVSGSIQANGRNAINTNPAGLGITGGGGGAGGVVVLLAKGTVTMGGSIQTNAGNGANGFDGNGGNAEGGGGGGGGGIIIYVASAISVTGTNSVAGGTAGANAGASATINPGGGGGACGGNGGNGGGTTSTVSVGSSGRTLQIISTAPETLVF
jgi:hypothetical protein